MLDPTPAFTPPSRIGQIAVPVEDLERAVGFYGGTLGLKLLFRAPPGLAFFDCGGVRLMLGRREGAAAPASAGLIYYLVSDLPAAHHALQERGVEFLEPPHPIARLADHELWIAFCRDTEGNVLGLMSEVRPPPG